MLKATKPRSKVWKYFKERNVHGKRQACCLYCSATYANNATRMTQHVLVCTKCPESIKVKRSKSPGTQSRHEKSSTRIAEKYSSDSESEHVDANLKHADISHQSSLASQPLLQKLKPSCSTMLSDKYAARSSTVQSSMTSESDVTVTNVTEDSEDAVRPPVKQSRNSERQAFESVQISSFVDQMSKQDQEKTDKQIARAIYASGCPLSFTENSLWVKALHTLRPAYVPPSRYELSNRLLENEYNAVKTKVHDVVVRAPCFAI